MHKSFISTVTEYEDAGYTTVIAGVFMGVLSGSGDDNVAVAGLFKIPAMKKTGLYAHLAANIELAESTLGNMSLFRTIS